MTLSTDTQTKMLGWLPQLGEWYTVRTRALWAFESREECQTYFDGPSRPKMRHNSKTMFCLENNVKIFVTRVTLPRTERDPAIFDFLAQDGNQGLTKVMFFVLFPPSTAEGARIWESILEHTYV